MHYYSHHIDSYTSATRHLTLLEDLAYRRMLEVYYRDEGPLQGDAAAIARRIGMREQIAEVQSVLAEFFTNTTDGWCNGRCETEIDNYRQVVDRNRTNGALGGRPKKPSGFPVGSQSQPSGIPLETQSKPTGNPPNPNPVPQPQSNSNLPPPRTAGSDGGGGGIASLQSGEGERGPEFHDVTLGERHAIFALLGATTMRSKSKNRRQILDEIAASLALDGLSSDQVRRLIAKAKAETKGDYGALLGEWLRPGVWRDKWAEIVEGRTGGLLAGLASNRRID